MLQSVAVNQLKPNPFRRLDEYPIIREKVDALSNWPPTRRKPNPPKATDGLPHDAARSHP